MIWSTDLKTNIWLFAMNLFAILAFALFLAFNANVFGKSVKCYQCGPGMKDCEEGKCTGQKCGTITGKLAGFTGYQKMCLNLKMSDGCYKLGKFPINLPVKMDGEVCICSSNYCNGAGKSGKGTDKKGKSAAKKKKRNGADKKRTSQFLNFFLIAGSAIWISIFFWNNPNNFPLDSAFFPECLYILYMPIIENFIQHRFR